MTVEFTARFDDSLGDYVKEVVGEEVGDLNDKMSEAISDFFTGGYTDPTDYFDMSNFVTEDDALTDSAVTELIDERLSETGLTALNETVTTLATTLQAITDALVANGFVPTGWQAIPKREEVA